MFTSTATSVLLVENEPLIAIDLEEMLRAGGIDKVAHVLSRSDAHAWLDSTRPDLAIVDLNLGDGSGHDLAQRLKTMGIPFIVYSGHTKASSHVDRVFDGAVWLAKPCAPAELAEAMAKALRLTL